MGLYQAAMRDLVRSLALCLTLLLPGMARADAPWLSKDRSWELAFIELGLRGVGDQNTAYTARLKTFRFEPVDSPQPFPLVASVGVMPWRWFGVVARYTPLHADRYERSFGGARGSHDVFRIRARVVEMGLRARLPLHEERIAFTLQVSAGLGLGQSRLDQSEGIHDTERHRGPVYSGVAGFHWNWFDYAGMYFDLGGMRALIFDNLAGDRHDSGGMWVSLGVRGMLPTKLFPSRFGAQH